ncbi:MAG: SDR family oxidoreductase, partial [Bacteroidota bacterium]
KPDANSVYGRSKLEGEKEIMNKDNCLIIRTSWLYSEFGLNFFKTMQKLMKEHEKIKVVFDQVGTPTYATDLAGAIMEIISSSINNKFKNGIYHYSNEGVASWFDFSKEIARLTGYKGEILAVESNEFPRPAPRPPFSVMNKSKIKEVYTLNIPYWKDSLEKCFNSL